MLAVPCTHTLAQALATREARALHASVTVTCTTSGSWRLTTSAGKRIALRVRYAPGYRKPEFYEDASGFLNYRRQTVRVDPR